MTLGSSLVSYGNKMSTSEKLWFWVSQVPKFLQFRTLNSSLVFTNLNRKTLNPCFHFVLHLVNLNSFDVLPIFFFLTQIYDFSFVVSLDLLFFLLFSCRFVVCSLFVLVLLCRCWHRFLCCIVHMFIYNIILFSSIVL
jgi:hypothetical protein